MKQQVIRQGLNCCEYALWEDGRPVFARHIMDEREKRMHHSSDYETAKYAPFANRAICREWVTV